MIVVDTNTIVYLLIPGKNSRQAEKLFKQDSVWSVPRLWRSEFRNVLIKYVRAEYITFDHSLRLMQSAEDLFEEREFEVNSDNILEISYLSKCSSYDTEFVALARELRTYLITWDKKLIQQFPDLAVSAEDYLKS